MPELADSPAATYAVCSVPISAVDASEAARRIVRDAVEARACQVHLCNAFTLSLVDQDDDLRTALLEADLNLADGVPVALLGRRHGMKGPVRGSELVGKVATMGSGRLRHYLYGGKDGIAQEMAGRLQHHVPGLQVVGTESPPFTPITDEHVGGLVRRVEESRANILWIGLGTPRQDYLVRRLADRLSMPIVPVGAAFDFWAGSIKEAPRVVQGTGLEWLYRLAVEPRRLWRRYLLGNPRFLLSAWRHRG
ncbi:MAG TPA: WecB/TagA/CpsF family glycosyltransferase [Nocardioides sp.]|uniref:WecB/TagA/CpsF family glycosyltransferase n=1 Tax=Nocardioides sp. TaxID=35761 RepID=UPI002F42CF1B